MKDVLFVRTPVQKAQDVTTILRNLYFAEWRVVSHTVSRDEYTFVMESAKDFIPPPNPDM